MFELNLLDPKTEASLFQCQLLPLGVKLLDVLPNSTYVRIKKHLEYVRSKMPEWMMMTMNDRVKGIHAEYMFNALTSNWERKRPFWILLMINSLTQQDVRMRGVHVLDKFLALEAQRLKKKTGAVERVEEQCHPLNQLNSTLVLFALNQALTQHESIRRGSSRSTFDTDHLIQQYMCGDFSLKMFDTRLASSSLISHQTDSPLVSQTLSFPVNNISQQQQHSLQEEMDRYFKEELILKRNVQMGRRITHLLRSDPNNSFFFALGAGHFLGNNSVVDYLIREGIDVVRVSKSSSPLSSRHKKGQKEGSLSTTMTTTPVSSSSSSSSLSPLSRVRPVFLPRS